jgi:hypothetical protein
MVGSASGEAGKVLVVVRGNQCHQSSMGTLLQCGLTTPRFECTFSCICV